MRFALSAMAATSGLLLLGLAFYGQPALYMQQVREEFDRLVAGSPTDQSDPAQSADADAVNDRMAALQQQVARLRDELAAKQSYEPPSVPASRLKPEPQAEPVTSEQAVTVPQSSPPIRPLPFSSVPVGSAPSAAVANQFLLTPVAPPPAVQSSAGGGAGTQGDTAKLDWLAPSNLGTSANLGTPAIPGPPASIVQQRRDMATAELPLPPAVPLALPKSEQAKADISKPKTIKSEAAKAEPPKTEPIRTEPVRAEPAKVVALPKPVAAKPQSAPSSARQDVDDTQSVLARLRQTGPTTMAQLDGPGVVEPRQPEPKTSVSPSLPKLNTARAALAAGRIDDARRLLQEAQLQLVFRPVNVTSDEQPLAGKSAADVAHALEALSANNIPLSRRYIDVAAADLSGTGTNLSPQAPDLRPTGYAPAYPPR